MDQLKEKEVEELKKVKAMFQLTGEAFWKALFYQSGDCRAFLPPGDGGADAAGEPADDGLSEALRLRPGGIPGAKADPAPAGAFQAEHGPDPAPGRL